MTDKAIAEEHTAQFFEAALSSAEEMLGKDASGVIITLNAAAEYYLVNKNFERTEELLQRAATIASAEAHPNSERIKLAEQKLGWLKFLQEDKQEAETYFLQAFDLMITDQSASEEGIAQALRCLVYFYIKTAQLDDADGALKKLLNVYQGQKQESNYKSAFVYMALAVVADAREDVAESKANIDKAAEIIKDKCAIGYTVDFLSLSEIINLYFIQERKIEALDIVACAMLESEDSFWPHNPVAGDALSSLAEYMRGQRKFKQAESIYKRAILIKELSAAGNADPDYARLSLNLGNMYLGLRKYADAEPLIKNAMKARVRHHGVEHPSVAACVETYATILRKTKRAALANKLDIRAREIRSVCVARLDKQKAEEQAASK